MDQFAICKNLLATYMVDWSLQPDGSAFCTHSSVLQPVVFQGCKAMLKIPAHEEEQRSLPFLHWWNSYGEGVVKVLRFDDKAVLMERLETFPPTPTLKQMALEGNDTQATAILCDVIQVLHTSVIKAPVRPHGLVPLKIWFEALFVAAKKWGGILAHSEKAAVHLFDTTQDEELVVLHGDIHHENVFLSSAGKWLAIDPKGLYGERGFDYANILCNPTLDIAVTGGRLMHQVENIARASGQDQKRLLQWVLAWSGLSASWMQLEPGQDLSDVGPQLGVAEIAYKALLKIEN